MTNFRELRNSLFWGVVLRIRNLFDPGSGIRDGKNSDPAPRHCMFFGLAYGYVGSATLRFYTNNRSTTCHARKSVSMFFKNTKESWQHVTIQLVWRQLIMCVTFCEKRPKLSCSSPLPSRGSPPKILTVIKRQLLRTPCIYRGSFGLGTGYRNCILRNPESYRNSQEKKQAFMLSDLHSSQLRQRQQVWKGERVWIRI
jgi:hypothetical protein